MKDRLSGARQRMVEEQIRRRGIDNRRVLAAIEAVPRQVFVPIASRHAAYGDGPLAIGHGQTISQPYIVALMTCALELQGSERVLEVGTGSGYQAAILSHLAAEIHTVELIPELAARAKRVLRCLGCNNVSVHLGDGSVGWPAAAPYSAIIVTAAAPALPLPLVEQLADPGRLVLPVVSDWDYQLLTLVRREAGRTSEKVLASVAFVPLRGKLGVKT